MPVNAGGSSQGVRKVGFHSFRTDTYKLHFFETPTGFKFVLTTDPGAGAPIGTFPTSSARRLFLPASCASLADHERRVYALFCFPQATSASASGTSTRTSMLSLS